VRAAMEARAAPTVSIPAASGASASGVQTAMLRRPAREEAGRATSRSRGRAAMALLCALVPAVAAMRSPVEGRLAAPPASEMQERLVRETLDRLSDRLRGCQKDPAFREWRYNFEASLRSVAMAKGVPSARLQQRLATLGTDAEPTAGMSCAAQESQLTAKLRGLASGLGVDVALAWPPRLAAATPPNGPEMTEEPSGPVQVREDSFRSSPSWKYIDDYISKTCTSAGQLAWAGQQSCFRGVPDRVPMVCIGAVEMFRSLPRLSNLNRECDNMVRIFRNNCARMWPDVQDCLALDT